MTIEKSIEKILICSAAGDDETARISQLLLEQQPDAVIKGIGQKADQLGINKCCLYIPAAYEKAITAVEAQAKTAGIKIQTGEDSVVCRDKTALISAYNGKIIRPYFCEDEETYVGYDNLAKYIFTVEDLVKLANNEEESKYLFVSGPVADGGLIKVDYGTSLSQVIELAGGLADETEIKAVLAGGLLGSYYSPDQLPQIVIEKDKSEFSGAIEVISTKQCSVDKTATLAKTARETSCGKCPLCREGSYQFQTIIADITKGKAKVSDIELMLDLAETIELGAFCEFGRNMVKPVRSQLTTLLAETEGHIKRKKCEAMVCKSFLTMAILPAKCTGCEECADVCEEDAIEGRKGYIHMIDNDLCEKCGKCIEVCEEDAIIYVGSVKPKLPKRLMRVGRFK